MKKRLVLLLIPLVLIPIALSFFPKTQEGLVNPIVNNIKNIRQTSELSEIAKIELLEGKGDYGIYVKNLKTDEIYAFNENKQFDSASLYKLWVMAVVFQKIKGGTISEDEVLSLPVSYLEETLSTESPTPSPEGAPSPTPTPPEEEKRISMEVGDAIERMITISDNYASLLLASRSGTASIVGFLRQEDFTNSNFRQPPQTTAEDIALFFEKLYDGEVVDSDSSDAMIEILKKQTLNDRIPKYLPENIEVAHKTGELFGAKHDAGIIFGKHSDFIIVVLTDTSDPTASSERIAKFSKRVFEYFETSQ